MSHHFFDLGIVVFVASIVAVFLGRFKQLPMIGYVIAGMLLGPAFFGIIENQADIKFIAEIGIILLLFILGMELPLTDFVQTYKPALLVTFGLVALSLAMTFAIGLFIELSFAQKIIYGFIISLSSTAVAIKLLEAIDLKNKATGQIALSVLIAQDLIFVPMVMIVNGMSVDKGVDFTLLPKIVAAVFILIALIGYLIHKGKVYLLFHDIVEKNKELIPVAALSWCFVGAGISEYFNLSPAYGSFLAGLVIGNSHSKDQVLHRIEPLQSVFIMAFFLSIGMMIDFKVIWQNLFLVTSLLLGTMIFKTIASIILLKTSLPVERWRCSFVTGLTISQIGEMSFILAATALGQGILDDTNYKVILAVIALSLFFSPLWVALLSKFVELNYTNQTANALGQALKKLVMDSVVRKS